MYTAITSHTHIYHTVRISEKGQIKITEFLFPVSFPFSVFSPCCIFCCSQQQPAAETDFSDAVPSALDSTLYCTVYGELMYACGTVLAGLRWGTRGYVHVHGGLCIVLAALVGTGLLKSAKKC